VAGRDGCSSRPDAAHARMICATSDMPTPSPGVTGPADRTLAALWRDGVCSVALAPQDEPGCTAVDQ
jgi:hypothetical protein